MQEKLTKAEIVETIFQKIQISKRDIYKIIDLVFEELKNALAKDKIIELRGLGTFEVRIRKGKKARNPKTGETVITEQHGVVFFKPGKELKQLAQGIKER
ncbi:MAG: integration host factor subunit beta [Spirochaetales bacterium]|nr:integration host factor subunit beta [Spirochaetales bacterium]